MEIVTACAAVSPAVVSRLIKCTAITPNTNVAEAKLVMSHAKRGSRSAGAHSAAFSTGSCGNRRCAGTNRRWMGRHRNACSPA